jgi:5'-3' exonuclease
MEEEIEHFELLLCFKRIIKLLTMGVKPVFVFDGKPPDLKKKTLLNRFQARFQQETNYTKIAQKMIINVLEKKPQKRASEEASQSTDPVRNYKTMTEEQEEEVLRMLDEYERAMEEMEDEQVSRALSE